NFEALEFARSLEIGVAINIIAEPDWDEERFRVVRDWCLDVPEVVNLSINTPYPGTETWLTGQHRLNTRDYRLFDIQHAVLPTKLPIAAFYRELLHTQRVLYRKHMTWWTVPTLARELAGNLVRGQTNFMRGIMNYNKVYNVEKMLADHARPVHYELPVSPRPETNAPARKPLNSIFMRIEAGLAAALTIPPSASSMQREWGPPVECKIAPLSSLLPTDEGESDHCNGMNRQPVVWFEVEDFLRYLDHFRNPSGVQRVSFEIYRAAKPAARSSKRSCCSRAVAPSI